jgi:hypothetical protein
MWKFSGLRMTEAVLSKQNRRKGLAVLDQELQRQVTDAGYCQHKCVVQYCPEDRQCRSVKDRLMKTAKLQSFVYSKENIMFSFLKSNPKIISGGLDMQNLKNKP